MVAISHASVFMRITANGKRNSPFLPRTIEHSCTPNHCYITAPLCSGGETSRHVQKKQLSRCACMGAFQGSPPLGLKVWPLDHCKCVCPDWEPSVHVEHTMLLIHGLVVLNDKIEILFQVFWITWKTFSW